MFLRSPSGTSPGISPRAFSTGRLSPVRALSAHFRLAQQAAVGADRVPRLQHHHVPGHHLPPRHLKHPPVPHHLGGGGRHLLQAVQGGGGLHGLHGAQHRVHGDDRQDDHHALHIPQDGGDDGGQDQDDHQKVRELLQKNPQDALPSALLQFIGAILFQAAGGIRAGQARGRAVQLLEQLLPALLPDGLFRLHKTPSFRQDAKKRDFCVNASALIQKSRRFNPKRGRSPY